MPPRAVGRRTSSRLASAQPDESLSSSPSDALPSLSRPNLPRLAGTPASRRQYTYGSAAEPPPSRPGRGIRMDQPLDLGRAVDNTLSRQEREDQASSRKQMPPPPRPIADEDAEDELASEGPPEPEPQTRRPGRPRKAAGQRGSEESRLGNTGHHTRASASMSPAKSRQPTRQQLEDMRDDRSFGTESDYYGNASIRSSPAPTLASTRSSRNTASKRSSNLRQEPLLNAVDETPYVVQQPPQMPPQEEITLETVPPAPNTEPVPLVVQDTRPQDTTFNRRQLRINPRPPSQPAPLLAHDEALPHGVTYVDEGASSSFQPANGRPFRPHTSLPPRRRREDPFPSNHSEADDAMQRDIAAAEADGYDTTNLFRRAWAQLTSFASIPDRHPADGRVRLHDLPEDDDLDHENPSVNWWYLLYPQTYLNFIVKVMDAVNDHFELLWRTVFGMLPSGRVWQRFFSLLAAIACVMFLVVNASTLADVAHSAAASVQSIPRPDVSSSFSGLSDMASKVGDFASSIHIPMPSFGGRKPSIWEELDDAERDELGAYLRKFDADFENLRSASSLHGASIEKLSEILPHIIHVKSSGDKLTIGTDFYYAMRDKLRDDEAILTFDDSRGDYVVDSDKQWQSLVRGISNDPYLDRKINLSMSSIESRLDGKMTSFWDSWIKDNDDKITAQLGTALESLKAANSEAELDAIVKKLVKDQIRESTADGGTLVTRDDFIKQLHREFKVHRHEIRTELDELQPQLKSLVKETVRLAHIQDAPPAGMTRDDVTTLVSTLIRKAIGDIDLTAMAKGKIYAHWDTDLKNQVNYFGVGGGAVADPKLSSTTYDPYNKGLANMAAFARGIRDARPLPHIAALQKWDDEGDCWCAAREVNHRGNPHGATLSVLLAHQVIPQHIVIEHILPGATSDPGARPREIEVHIRIEDPEVLSRVQDFSATHFVERSDDWNYSPAELGSRFVKVGQFTYEGAELHDGVHVQSLSRELVEMGAETDQVVVRAISNYGAKEHTCFYRVRLYGERIGIDV